MTATLECRNLSKNYGKKQVLKNISFEIQPGHITGLLGPNGSGKTTFIKLVNGLLTPTEGSISVMGLPIGTETKARVSYLPDKDYLSDWMNARQLFDLFQDFYDDFDRKKAEEMIQRLNINPSSPLKTLSKGTKEKVQLILIMSRNADLYLLDEPIGGVDPAARDYILNTILTNYSENGSILISTHLISDVEKILDDVIFLKEGSIVLQSSVDDIRSEYGKSVDMVFREVFKC